MNKIAIFCKSYRDDIYRARRMAESVNRYNADGVPLYISVPASHLDDFRICFKDIHCIFITDEEILERTCEVFGNVPESFPEHLMQQLIKLEFWRMGYCQNYLVIDSDSYFIRKFNSSDFLMNESVPYTVQHELEELRDFAKRRKRMNIIRDFEEQTKHFKKIFDRTGPDYDFGPSPIIWSCAVLKSLYDDYIKLQSMTIYRLLTAYPCEMQLYGEYLHHSKRIPIVPIPPIFKVFHYLDQYLESQMMGESEYSLSKEYLGVVVQSNWSSIKEKKKLKDRIKYRFEKTCMIYKKAVKFGGRDN